MFFSFEDLLCLEMTPRLHPAEVGCKKLSLSLTDMTSTGLSGRIVIVSQAFIYCTRCAGIRYGVGEVIGIYNSTFSTTWPFSFCKRFKVLMGVPQHANGETTTHTYSSSRHSHYHMIFLLYCFFPNRNWVAPRQPPQRVDETVHAWSPSPIPTSCRLSRSQRNVTISQWRHLPSRLDLRDESTPRPAHGHDSIAVGHWTVNARARRIGRHLLGLGSFTAPSSIRCLDISSLITSQYSAQD